MKITGLFLLSMALIVSQAFCQNTPTTSQPPVKTLSLSQAVICESIKDYVPKNSAVVFSITMGEIFCFTSFDIVQEQTFIHHKWYHYDKLSAKRKLKLNTPRWSTFSSIQLREDDKGPWRIEISDKDGNNIKILRFSITD